VTVGEAGASQSSSATNDIGIITLPDGRHLAVRIRLRVLRPMMTRGMAIIARLAKAAWIAPNR